MTLNTGWKLGASIKEPEKINLYFNEFTVFELDINRFDSYTDFEHSARLVHENHYQLHTIHLLYHNDDLNYGLEGIEIVKHLRPVVFVYHLCYPKNENDLGRQICTVSETAEKHGVRIALENLADRSNKSKGFMGARDPISLARAVKKYGSSSVGTTLDTSHAICNQVRWWNNDDIAEKLLHIHLSGGSWGQDNHFPVSSSPIKSQLPNLKKLLTDSAFKGMVSLENFSYEDMKKSADYLRSNDMFQTAG